MNQTVYKTVDIRIDTQRTVTLSDILREYALAPRAIEFDTQRAVTPSPDARGFVRFGATQTSAHQLQNRLGADLVRVSQDFYLR